jgi:DNA polymerase-1
VIIQADAKGLETVGVAYLSRDKVMMQELMDGVDLHGVNQAAFNLPTRLIAKTFVFRLIYGGSAYSYANDVNFTHVSTKEKYWQNVIDTFYAKYSGIESWHRDNLKKAMMEKQLVMPTGRIYRFNATPNWKGELVIPETTVKNYPVQGLGADIMSIIRVEFHKRWFEENINGVIVNTVHDSIVVDVPKTELVRVYNLFKEVFENAPRLFEETFGVQFDLPLPTEVSYGNNMKELTEMK